jgi:predicted TIM-barrel fold metal-dependent hydrolase
MRFRGLPTAIIALAVIAAGIVLFPSACSRRPEDVAPAGLTKPLRRIPKIDVHAHVDPDVMMPLRDMLLAQGIVHVVNLSGGSYGYGLEQTVLSAAAAGGYYLTSANVQFDAIGAPGWANREIVQLEHAKRLGVKGVKIPKSLGLSVLYYDGRRVPVDDPVLDPLFDAMARLGLPLSIHTGDPKAFFDAPVRSNERYAELSEHPSWSFSDRRHYPSWEDLFGEFERRVKRSRNTTIIGVHFGNAPEDPARVGRMLDECPNYYIDTAARVPEIGRKAAETRRVILEHPDRVMFGTDLQIGPGMLVLGAGPARGHSRKDVEHFFVSTWRFFETADKGFAHPTPIQGNWTIDGIDLPDDVLHKVYHGNAERLFGLAPSQL